MRETVEERWVHSLRKGDTVEWINNIQGHKRRVIGLTSDGFPLEKTQLLVQKTQIDSQDENLNIWRQIFHRVIIIIVCSFIVHKLRRSHDHPVNYH